MYLLDTNVLSEMRKGIRGQPALQQWVKQDLLTTKGYVSVLALGEIRKGIEQINRRDPESALHLEKWHVRLREEYAGRILPVTLEVAEEWGRLNVNRPLPTADSLMAATANVHGLILVTRDVKALADTGVRVLNPFAAKAGG